MKRILIIGSGGAGKSTFAIQLAEHTNIPLIHLDEYYWKPGWEATKKEEWQKIVQQLIKKPSWIMDGNYGGSLSIRFPAADTIIFFDRSRYLCLWRILKRWWRYKGKSRPSVTEGCPERLTFEFLHYIFFYPNTRKPAILDQLKSMENTHKIYIFRSEKDINRFLANLSNLKK